MTAVLPDAPELLAPAGNRDCARAAVANGADAVYFGLDGAFNARVRAAGFSAEGLPELLAFLHRNGVRGYVTLNTLAFSDELEMLETIVRQIAEAGADGVLVQDLGLLRMIRRIAPGVADPCFDADDADECGVYRGGGGTGCRADCAGTGAFGW